MEDKIFFNQSKYIKEMLKKFGLEDSKPTKTPMSTEIKLTKEDEADIVDGSKYQGESLSIHITLSFHTHQEMDQQYPIVAKIPILDTGKFELWQFRIQQYLQHEHYALWEVIEFRDSYEVPTSTTDTTTTYTTSGKTGTNKYKTTRELWAAILKTFGGNEATKKTKKNLLKQQYGNFKAEGSETLEQTFSRLQVIIGQLQFMDVEFEHDDLNQKFLTSLDPEWLMHTIVWRNRSYLDTMRLDDLYNHHKVYESEVQKKMEPNSQNMAFISSATHNSRNEDGNTAYVPTASTNVPTVSASVATISQDTACAYITSQSNGSQIKFEDINQINEDDMEEMDMKWNMELLSMRADKWVTLQESARLPEAKIEEGEITSDREDHALVANKESPTEFALIANTCTESKVFDNSLCSKDCKKNNDSLNNKNKEGLGYSAVPPPPTQLYSSPKKDLSWTGLPECKDETLTDYNRPEPTVESSPVDDKKRNPSVFKTIASPIIPKPFVKFVKASNSQSKSKTDEIETPKKSPVKYAEQYRKTNKKPNVRGNQRN
uniref:Uncharacterized protein n=1 Tax=Tanacetum cinerariifolium TaxID=118510 RepID=A0A699IQW0_TANCI|nr:hypothetical protein [Tanacetum cinerariifolium]